MNESEIAVTIRCIAYNQVAYIRDCLDGFVMQKTNFKFEAIVHDDASTDGTTEIIIEYAERYPDIIKPILEKENQWSKHDGSIARIVNSHIRGKYVALCEGDDYWTDPLKLQMQYDEMEKHPEIDMCSHIAVSLKGGKIHGYRNPLKHSGIISVEQMIEGGGGIVATNSLFLRKEIFDDFLPFQKVLNVDYSIQLRGALRGGVLFVNRCMSVYRVNAVGSWSERLKSDKTKVLNFHQKIQEMLDSFDVFTGGRYKRSIEWKKKQLHFEDARVMDDWTLIKDREYADVLKKLNMRDRVHLYLQHYAPWLVTPVSRMIDIIRHPFS